MPQTSERYHEALGLIQVLIKTTKSYRIYALNNPILTKFVEQLHRKLTLYLKKHGSFRIAVDEFAFTFDGEVIYENENMDESLPFLMHRNGLRELWFDDGLTHEEINDFLKAFRSYEIIKDSHEDLVTLLWDKEFSHIHFLATDDFLWGPIEIPENMKNIIEKMELPMSEQKNIAVEMKTPFWLFESGELDEIKEIPQEIGEVDYINLLMIVLEVIGRFEKDSEGFELGVAFFRRVLDRLINLSDLKNLIKVLSFTRILLRDPRLDSSEGEFIGRITDHLGEAQSIERLMIMLARVKGFDHRQLQQYLFLLSKNVITPLCNAWPKIESAESRTAISNALVELGKQDIPTLGRLLTSTQSWLVRNLVTVLGKIGKDECIPHIARVKGHRDSKVRNEALHALSLFNHQDTKALLTNFVNDPEMQIRINAAKILAKKMGAEALPYLGPIILSEEFDKHELAEKRAFLEALGKIKTPDSVKILEEILYRRAFSKRAEWKEIKYHVESILASMHIDRARDVLVKWKGERRKWSFRR
jgi:hypothetical protein